MPKISSNKNEVISIKGLKMHFDIPIMYNQSNHFYYRIPREFDEMVILLDDEVRRALGIRSYYKSRFNTEGFMVSRSNESECLSAAKTALGKILESKPETDNVIILLYDGDSTVSYGGMKYDDEHPQIGLKMGITYAIRTRLGDQVMYYQPAGPEGKHRREVRIWKSSCTVIKDTP